MAVPDREVKHPTCLARRAAETARLAEIFDVALPSPLIGECEKVAASVVTCRLAGTLAMFRRTPSAQHSDRWWRHTAHLREVKLAFVGLGCLAPEQGDVPRSVAIVAGRLRCGPHPARLINTLGDPRPLPSCVHLEGRHTVTL